MYQFIFFYLFSFVWYNIWQHFLRSKFSYWPLCIPTPKSAVNNKVGYKTRWKQPLAKSKHLIPSVKLDELSYTHSLQSHCEGMACMVTWISYDFSAVSRVQNKQKSHFAPPPPKLSQWPVCVDRSKHFVYLLQRWPGGGGIMPSSAVSPFHQNPALSQAT